MKSQTGLGWIMAVVAYFTFRSVIPKGIEHADPNMSVQYNLIKWCINNYDLILTAGGMLLCLALALQIGINGIKIMKGIR
jgi:hypothetical protein